MTRTVLQLARQDGELVVLLDGEGTEGGHPQVRLLHENTTLEALGSTVFRI